jgi:signal transduction histidine kinase
VTAMNRVEMPDRATVNESYQVITACSLAEREPGTVAIDFSRTVRFGPLGLALVAASIAMRREANRATELILPKDAGAAEFCREVALDQFLAGQMTGLGTLEIRQMRQLDALYTQQIAQILVRGVPGVTEDSSYVIQLCLNELLQNVFEWSKSTIGCIVFARWFKRTRSVRLAVVDRGIGIPAALRAKKIEDLHRKKDAEVIEAAVTAARLTSRANQVGGLGLKTVREVVCARDGRLTVISHAAKVSWRQNRVSKFRTPALRGTAIEIDVRPDSRLLVPPDNQQVF